MSRLVLAVFALVVVGFGSPAMAAPRASVVMDMRDGKMLYARSADRRLHPASLTKMMTLYVTFDAIRRGKLKLGQKLKVSRRASRQPASKLYLRAGQRVSVRSLINATAIKSANDAAMVLAEGVGGSQARFARMMTKMAKRLGMKNTRFLNPHGLTQRGHYSTARDMAILARHLFHDFPEHYHIFARKRSQAAGKRIYSTNRLLSSYSGADGIKTGYTRAAGYNLVASAHRGKKRIVAVAFGQPSSRVRNRRVAALLDIGFARAKRSVRVVRPGFRGGPAMRAPRRLVKHSPVPPKRPGVHTTVADAVAAVLATPAAAATLHRSLPAETLTFEDGAPKRDVKVVRKAGAATKPMSTSRLAPRTAQLPPRRTRRNARVEIAKPAAARAAPAARSAKAGAAMPVARPGKGEARIDTVATLANGVSVPIPPARPG